MLSNNRKGVIDLDYRYTDEIYHHGIKGQKWGIRRFQNRNGTLTAAGKKRKSNKTKGLSKEAKRANAIKKKSVHQMTNKELSELNKRQELENKYKQNNPSTIKKGMKVAGTIVATMGTISALYNNSQNMNDMNLHCSLYS